MNTHPLAIPISPGDARPIFRQIVEEIRLQITQGILPVGCKLPSQRALATQLRVNPNTIAKSYSELTAQGFIEARRGLGVFVVERRQTLHNEEQKRRLKLAIDRFINDVILLDFDQATLSAELNQALAKALKPMHNESE